MPLCQEAGITGITKTATSKGVTPDTPQGSAPNSPQQLLSSLRKRREKPRAGCPQPEGVPRRAAQGPGEARTTPQVWLWRQGNMCRRHPGPHATSKHAGDCPQQAAAGPGVGAGAGRRPQWEQPFSGYSTARMAGVGKRKPSSLFRLIEQSQSGLASGQAHPPGLRTWGELETTCVNGSNAGSSGAHGPKQD